MLGVAYFPRTDPSQFVINLKAPTGTRLENTQEYVKKVEDIIRQEVSTQELGVVVANIGVTPGFSSMYTPNSAQHTAFVQASLKEGHKTGSYEYMNRVRQRLARDLPEVSAYLQSGGLVDAVLNLGLPAPMDIQVSGTDIEAAHQTASELAQKIRALPGVSDVLVPQDVDYPALQLDIDRQRASELGLSSKEVVGNVITALTSDQMIAPSYWVDPKSGNDYLLTVQYFEGHVKNMADLNAIPVRSVSHPEPARLDAVSRIRHIHAPTEVDHYQLRRVMDVYVAT
jgi:multidrug efflux pump subunit AcrB